MRRAPAWKALPRLGIMPKVQSSLLLLLGFFSPNPTRKRTISLHPSLRVPGVNQGKHAHAIRVLLCSGLTMGQRLAVVSSLTLLSNRDALRRAFRFLFIAHRNEKKENSVPCCGQVRIDGADRVATQEMWEEERKGNKRRAKNKRAAFL